MRCPPNIAYQLVIPIRKAGFSTSNYVKLMKDIMNVLAPKHAVKVWQLMYRHIKGGIFMFRLE